MTELESSTSRKRKAQTPTEEGIVGQNLVNITRQLLKLRKQIRSMGKKVLRDLCLLQTNYSVSLNNINIQVDSLLNETNHDDDLDRLKHIHQILFRLYDIVTSKKVRCTGAVGQEAAEHEAVKNEVESVINGSEEFGNTKTFQVVGTLGKGKFGTVFKVSNGIHNYAIKFGDISPHELEVMSLIGDNYPNLVGAKASFSLKDGRNAVVMDVHGEELFDLLLTLQYSEQERYIILTHLANGVNDLHNRGYAHMDLKAENVLCTQDKKRYVIGDFGMATCDELSCIRCGSPNYVAPEVIRATIDTPYDPSKADMWSLGVLFYVVLMVEFPYDNIETLIQDQIAASLSKVRAIYGPKVTYLLSKMMSIDPNDRLSIKEVCDNLAQF